MTHHRSHTLHRGEKSIQSLRGTPGELTESITSYIDSDMSKQQAEFFANLSYLPLATLDKKGRPWASILVTQSEQEPAVGIRVSWQNEISIVSKINPYDPFVRALFQTTISKSGTNERFAGVGIDFSNRRRNKLAGVIKHADFDLSAMLSLCLQSNEHLGNCPKYITLRSLTPYQREAKLEFEHFDTFDLKLPNQCKDLINRASTAFLATKHEAESDDAAQDQSDMGLNHRGGNPGFIRVYEEAKEQSSNKSEYKKQHLKINTYLVIPDHSGNRFYQSLGNIQTNPLVGLAIPDFVHGNVLYVTGEAENLFDDEAEELMPRVRLLTKVKVTGAVYIKHALNLRMTADEQLSPYNPPIRYLTQELKKMGRTNDTVISASPRITATLESSSILTENIQTFTFQLSEKIVPPMPGGFGIFDFSEILDTGYSHMNEDNPQAVNEDFIRTWTFSSAPEFDVEQQQFFPVNRVSITIKHKKGGLISNFLHTKTASSPSSLLKKITPIFKGSGTGFSCFRKNTDSLMPDIPARMLWIAGGVGITPFMSMWDGILNINRALTHNHSHLMSDIVLLFSARGDDIALVKHFLNNTDELPTGIAIDIIAFQSPGDNNIKANQVQDSLSTEFNHSPLTILQRRINPSDLSAVDRLCEREVYLCGPEPFMQLIQVWLKSQEGDNLKIHQESFFF